MVGLFAVLVLFVFLSLGCGASLLEPENDILMHLDAQSVEGRDERFIQRGAREYAKFLSLPHVTRELGASVNAENEILKAAAVEMANLELVKEEDYRQFDSLFEAVCIIVRLRWAIPPSYAIANSEVVSRSIQNYKECTSYSESKTWQETCMAALLPTHFCYFDLDFIMRHLKVMIKAACSIGDWDTFTTLIGKASLDQRRKLYKSIAVNVSYSGSVMFFESVSSCFRKERCKLVMYMLESVFGFRREALLNHLLNLVPLFSKEAQDCIIGLFYHNACYFGPSSLVQDLYTRYSLSERHALIALKGATHKGHIDILKQVISLTENHDKSIRSSKAGQKAIYHCFQNAIMNNDLPMMKLLASRYRKENFIMLQSFNLAAKAGVVDMVDLLLGQDECNQYYLPVVTQRVFSAAMSAFACGGRLDLIKYYANRPGDGRFHGLTLTADANSLFWEACKGGWLNLVEFLLQKDENETYVLARIDPAANESQGLCEACQYGHLPIVKLLLTYETVNPAAMENRPINVAAQNAHWQIVRFLLQDSFDYQGHQYPIRGIDPAAGDNNVLKSAALAQNIDMVRLLLTRDENGSQVYPGIAVTLSIWYIRGAYTPEIVEILRHELRLSESMNYDVRTDK